jgi:hypothetical protein
VLVGGVPGAAVPGWFRADGCRAVVRVRAVEGVAGAQQFTLLRLARGVHRAVGGVVLVGAGVEGLAVVVAQVAGQGARAGCGAGIRGQVLAGAAGHRSSSVVNSLN